MRSNLALELGVWSLGSKGVDKVGKCHVSDVVGCYVLGCVARSQGNAKVRASTSEANNYALRSAEFESHNAVHAEQRFQEQSNSSIDHLPFKSSSYIISYPPGPAAKFLIPETSTGSR